MFTGLVRAVGTLVESRPQGEGRRLVIDAAGLEESPAIGASIAICGTCLTVTACAGTQLTFDAVTETIRRTTLNTLRPGSRVNMEPALRAGDALDGHIVQGHVDAIGTLLGLTPRTDSWLLRVTLPDEIRALVATKGSVAVDGISLTVVEAGMSDFTVSVIPHTFENTTLKDRQVGDSVNLEADVLARYAARFAQVSNDGGLTLEQLQRSGFA